MDNSPNSFDKNTEFFLLASYSSLPTVVARLVELQNKNIPAAIYCFTAQIYRLLSPLMLKFAWIKVYFIDDSEVYKISPRRPWELFNGRRLINSIYLKWFAGIPSGSRINFYNRYYALSTYFMIWRVRHRCNNHFTDCDLFDRIEFTRDRSILSILKFCFFFVLFPMPFEMLTGNDGVKPFPSLSKQFFDKAVADESLMITDLTGLKGTDLFQSLQFGSDKKVLWLMSPVLDLGLVPQDAYEQSLKACVKVVNSVYPSREQAIKFHPHTIKKENAWDGSVEYIPSHIPVEFLDMPNLKVVMAFSTSSFWSFSSKTIIIGLVDILPYISVEAHNARRRYFHLYQSNSKKYSPSSIDELNKILSDTRSEVVR